MKQVVSALRHLEGSLHAPASTPSCSCTTVTLVFPCWRNDFLLCGPSGSQLSELRRRARARRSPLGPRGQPGRRRSQASEATAPTSYGTCTLAEHILEAPHRVVSGSAGPGAPLPPRRGVPIHCCMAYSQGASSPLARADVSKSCFHCKSQSRTTTSAIYARRSPSTRTIARARGAGFQTPPRSAPTRTQGRNGILPEHVLPRRLRPDRRRTRSSLIVRRPPMSSLPPSTRPRLPGPS